MVHKLRNRDVCHTSPRPNQAQSSFKTQKRQVLHSTPQHKQLKQKDAQNYHVIMADVSNIGQLTMPTLQQSDDTISVNYSAVFEATSNTKNIVKLQNAVDESIFKHTFGKRNGVSLYAVKKSLREEYSYKSVRSLKPISRYVAFAIKNGKFQQITGHGASGTFRLNRDIHVSHVRRLGGLRKVSCNSKAKRKQTN
ncbi:uncharacterized protein LOC101449154 isoform X2 [Ceratitis capitata]|uniref:uncharacterized protein LOC101449154 isoform X2 n=1 Tax=Ceratitis capitata TaxID=7213 RepID=UPI000A11EE6C|nr:uncharacterized protein LOC101449154 isoform X2 [Ceratitis capitata]